jgi:hypothetical protein
MFAALAAYWIFANARPVFNSHVILIGIAFLVSAVPLWSLALLTGPLHFLYSHLFFAALIVLVALWRRTADGWIFRPRNTAPEVS